MTSRSCNQVVPFIVSSTGRTFEFSATEYRSVVLRIHRIRSSEVMVEGHLLTFLQTVIIGTSLLQYVSVLDVHHP